MKIPPFSSALCGLLAAMTMAGVATPASAQDDPDDVVVYGRWHHRLPDDVQTASQRVSYADLDLRYAEDRRELRHRITVTARYLCDRLGESDDYGSSVVRSCREEAVRDALQRVGTEDAEYAPRDTAWTAPRWQEPDPEDQQSDYP